MIRAATEADIPRLVEMGSRSLLDGPYKNKIKDNPEQAAELALEVIRDRKGKVIIAEEDGTLIGLVGILFFPHYFTGEQTAAEIMWYVDEEWRMRKPFTGIALFRAAEREAKQAGCTTMQFSAPTQEVAQIYEKLGYEALEVCYRKTLN